MSNVRVKTNNDILREKEYLDFSFQPLRTLESLHLPRYASLWKLTLSRCSLSSLEGISTFSAFGLVDVSHNQLSAVTIQLALMDVEILRLNLYGNSLLAETEISEYRGFIVHSLPRVWSLDGTFITFTERLHWNTYFEQGKGQYAEVKRKHFVAPSHAFIPTRDRLMTPVPKRRISPWGSNLLRHMPRNFAMAKDGSLWRLDALCRDLGKDIKAWYESAEIAIEKSPDGNSAETSLVHSLIMGERGVTAEARAILVLLLLGTLIQDIPSPLCDEVANYLFSSTSSEMSSILGSLATPFSPFRWPDVLKIDLVGLLLARLTLDDSVMRTVTLPPYLLLCAQRLVVALLDPASHSRKRPDTKHALEMYRQSITDTISLEILLILTLAPSASLFAGSYAQLQQVFNRVTNHEGTEAGDGVEGPLLHHRTSDDSDVEILALEMKFKLVTSIEKTLAEVYTNCAPEKLTVSELSIAGERPRSRVGWT